MVGCEVQECSYSGLELVNAFQLETGKLDGINVFRRRIGNEGDKRSADIAGRMPFQTGADEQSGDQGGCGRLPI